MASTTHKGRLGNDPELRTSADGKKRATFSLAVSNGPRDGDIAPTWFNVTAFNGREDTFAENVVASFKKGDYVLIEGELKNYDKKVFDANGAETTVQMLSLNAYDVMAGSRYATIDVTRNPKSGGPGGGTQGGGSTESAPAKKSAPAASASDDF